MWDVEFYSLPSGRCPTNEFLSGLNLKTELPYVELALSRLEEMGYQLRRPHAAPLQDKIYELRVKTENSKIRLLYFFDNKKIIITNGLKKKTRSVPQCHIDLAIKYKNLYFEGKR